MAGACFDPFMPWLFFDLLGYIAYGGVLCLLTEVRMDLFDSKTKMHGCVCFQQDFSWICLFFNRFSKKELSKGHNQFL